MASVLLHSLDNLDECPRSTGEVLQEVLATAPLWLHLGNFQSRALDVLEALPGPVPVCWKIEYLGGRFSPFLADDPTAPLEGYVDRVLRRASPLLVRAFNGWNRDHISAAFPRLRDVEWLLVPLAQKPPDLSVTPEQARAAGPIPAGATLFGAAAVFHPAKGIEELCEMVLGLELRPDWHFLFTLIADEDGPGLKRRLFGHAAGSPWWQNVHVRQGAYREWPWMCAFYRAIDALLVNSRSDSWGRVVTEAVGLGTPVIVRREPDCGTNQLFGGLTLVEGFAGLSQSGLGRALSAARGCRTRLAAEASQHFAPESVTATFTNALREATPPAARPEFDRLHASGALGHLSEVIYH
jgi:hypothetical protein